MGTSACRRPILLVSKAMGASSACTAGRCIEILPADDVLIRIGEVDALG